MASVSRNLRRKRRIKRTNSLLKRQLKSMGTQGYKTHIILCALLAQKGGEMTVTAGTMQQAATDIAKLGYTVTPTAVEGELVVRLVVTEAPVASTEIEPDLPFDEQLEPHLPIGEDNPNAGTPDDNATTPTDPAPESRSVLDAL